jgi:hypothetical protein
VRLSAALALCLLAACGARWPEENRAAFTGSCLAQARKTRPAAAEEALAAYCECTVDYLQARYSLEEFTAMEARTKRDNKPPIEVVRAVEECAGRLR